MKTILQQSLSQQVTLTPQLQQAIKLLQLSAQDLEQEIQANLEANAMLEVNEAAHEHTNLDITETASENLPSTEEPVETDYNDTLNNEPPMEVQWQHSSQKSHNSTLDKHLFEIKDTSSNSLREHLLWQMRLTPFSEEDLMIATAIIDAINEQGYLGCSLEDIQTSLGQTAEAEDTIEIDQIEAIKHRIQQFDPIGTGSADLQEYLLLQLAQLDSDTSWLMEAKAIVTEHIDSLAKHDYKALKRAVKVQPQALSEILALIQTLNPRPSYGFNDENAQYITPDVMVRKHHGHWVVELTSDLSQRIQINNQYAGMVRRADNSDSNQFLKDQLQEARWFIKSLQSRNDTLLKVAHCIIMHQQDFLEKGELGMKPLVLQDIAEATELHESTISRITTQKYIHTPRGIFELKYFFSSHVNTEDGSECSSTAIRAMIKGLINEEEGNKPLSDNKIAQLLENNEGIHIARRTVAKYREAMGIPPSNERKRITEIS